MPNGFVLSASVAGSLVAVLRGMHGAVSVGQLMQLGQLGLIDEDGLVTDLGRDTLAAVNPQFARSVQPGAGIGPVPGGSLYQGSPPSPLGRSVVERALGDVSIAEDPTVSPAKRAAAITAAIDRATSESLRRSLTESKSTASPIDAVEAIAAVGIKYGPNPVMWPKAERQAALLAVSNAGQSARDSAVVAERARGDREMDRAKRKLRAFARRAGRLGEAYGSTDVDDPVKAKEALRYLKAFADDVAEYSRELDETGPVTDGTERWHE